MKPNQLHNRQIPLAKKYDDMILKEEMRAREQIMQEQALAKDPGKKKTKTWSLLNFGKHKGKTLPEIIACDPHWFAWACEQEIFRDALKKEAKMLQKGEQPK